MLNDGETLVTLVDIEDDEIDTETGDRKIAITKGKQLILNVNLVGIQTMQLGQAQGIEYSYSLKIERILYDEEKFCYFNGHLYEVKGMSKADKSNFMLLNVVKSTNKEVENAVLEWLEANNDL